MSHLFFHVVAARYERGSTMLTSNLGFGVWDDAFVGDGVLTPSMLDRLPHHRHMVQRTGDSYRLMEKRQAWLVEPQKGSSQA